MLDNSKRINLAAHLENLKVALQLFPDDRKEILKAIHATRSDLSKLDAVAMFDK